MDISINSNKYVKVEDYEKYRKSVLDILVKLNSGVVSARHNAEVAYAYADFAQNELINYVESAEKRINQLEDELVRMMYADDKDKATKMRKRLKIVDDALFEKYTSGIKRSKEEYVQKCNEIDEKYGFKNE